MLNVCGHRVLVEPDPVEKKVGSILIVQDERLARAATSTGTIVSIGPNAWKAFDNGEPWAKVGDKIVYARYSGKMVTDPETTKEYLVINDDDVQCTVT